MKWMNLCIDIGDLLSQSFKRAQLKCTEKIVLKSTFHLRRAFTMKTSPLETHFDSGQYYLNE